MRVAFVEPAMANVEPLGIGYLAQMLIDNGYEVRYFEAPRRNFFAKIKEFNPQVLAYSVTTGKHRLCRNLNRALRGHFTDAVSLFGGAHCTFYPEFIESDPLIDGVCQGEGEYALLEFLNKLDKSQDYSGVANWHVRYKEKIYRNQVREKIADLDSIPFPNRDIIYSENPGLLQSPIKRIITSRGCPFACSYCFNKKYNAIYADKGKVYRSRSPRNIVAEAKAIRDKYPFTFLKIADDIFGMTMDFDEFAGLYGKQVGIPFTCNFRPNLVERERVKKLKAAGCVAITIALESGNDFIRNSVLHRNLSQEVMEKAFSILKEEGLRIWSQNIIGSPGETLDMAMETFNFNVRHKVDFAECNLLSPFPGTAVYNYCVENNYFDGEIDNLPRSFCLDSRIRFSSRNEKKQFINFHKFFSFAAKHPGSLPLVKILMKFPPNRLFVFFNRVYDMYRVSRVIRARFGIINFIATVRINLEYVTSYFLRKTDDWAEIKIDR
jgi:radical SAM superfamily enzyme YgiQ (UPF0313 family)